MARLPQGVSRLQTQLGLFASWWLQELREAGEAALARLVPRWVTRTLILLEPAGGSVWTVRGAHRERVSTFVPDVAGAGPQELGTPEVMRTLQGKKAVFGLAPQYVLAHKLSLPASVERELDKVVALQLERDCPMRLDQVYVDRGATTFSRDGAKLEVTVLIVQRERVDRVRDLARACGIRVGRVGMIYGAGDITGDFLRTPAAMGRLGFTRTDRRLGMAAVAVAVVCAVLIPLQWGYERVMIGRRLHELQEPASAAEKLARKLKEDAAPAAALVSLMRQPDALDVLTTLTQDTPKDTWFYDLEISAQWPQVAHVKLSGFTPTATVLIGALQNTGRLREVRLVFASSAGLGSGEDRLQLTAQLAPSVRGAPDGGNSSSPTVSGRLVR